GHLGARALGGLHDLASRLIEQLVVVGLEPDSNLLGCHSVASDRVLARELCPGSPPVPLPVKTDACSPSRNPPPPLKGRQGRGVRPCLRSVLLDDLGDDARADGAAALTD